MPYARPVGLDPDQIWACDEQASVREPVRRPAESIGAFSDHLAVAVEIDGDDLPRAPVREPQPAVVPARRLGYGQAIEQYARLHAALLRRVYRYRRGLRARLIGPRSQPQLGCRRRYRSSNERFVLLCFAGTEPSLGRTAVGARSGADRTCEGVTDAEPALPRIKRASRFVFVNGARRCRYRSRPARRRT